MKKRFFSLLILLAAALGLIFSLGSCSGNTYREEGYSIEKDGKGIFEYDESSNSTYVEIPIKIENNADSSIRSLSFIADFKDSVGDVITSKTIILSYEDYHLDIAPGDTYYMDLEFYGGSEFGSVKGNAVSLSLRPYSMTLDTSAKEDDGEKTFGILQIVIAVICIGAIIFGIWLIYDGFYLGLDWLRRYPEDIAKPVFGILLCLASVGWAIAYYFFIW